MNARVHIFAGDPSWEAAAGRYLHHCLGPGLRVDGYQFSELDACSRDTFVFDAAVAAAFTRQGDTGGPAHSGATLFAGFPGRVVLVSALWLQPPPPAWPLCLAQPLARPDALAAAVRLALAGPPPAGPSLDELRAYLPLGPAAGARHHARGER
jgi:hypothetical protein